MKILDTPSTMPDKIPLTRDEIKNYDVLVTRPILLKIFLMKLVLVYILAYKGLFLKQGMSGKGD